MNELFSHIYVINMKKRLDKRRLMEFKMDCIGLTKYSFFEGIDGSMDSLNDVYESLIKKRLFTSKGALGLVMTYIELLKDIHTKGYESVLILEDDVNVHIHHEKLMKLFNNTLLDKRYDIVWLGANQTRMNKTQFSHVKRYYNYEPDPAKSIYTYGTFSIVLKKSGVEKMMMKINIQNLKNLKPIDLMLNDMISYNELKGVVCYPYAFMPDVSNSDNMGPRDQIKFASSRGFRINDYFYVSHNIISDIAQYIQKNKVSLEEFKCIKIDRFKDFIKNYENNMDILDKLYKLLCSI
jgi:GR25 family glycosyltransferase involved in LPS biosynthesis